MKKSEWIAKVENDAREYAEAYRPCFASYSTSNYVKSFASKRWDTYKSELLDKDIEIPKNWEDSIKKHFCSTFTNMTLDYIKNVLSKQPKNPYVEKAMKKDK